MEEREPRTRRGRAAAFKRRKAGVLRQIQQVADGGCVRNIITCCMSRWLVDINQCIAA